jgi:hypothetical protein
MTIKTSDEDGPFRIEADRIAGSQKSCGPGHFCYRKEGAECCLCAKVAKRSRCNVCRQKKRAKES